MNNEQPLIEKSLEEITKILTKIEADESALNEHHNTLEKLFENAIALKNSDDPVAMNTLSDMSPPLEEKILAHYKSKADYFMVSADYYKRELLFCLKQKNSLTP